MTQVVPIESVKSLTEDNISNWHINKMVTVLQKQGQIEPLQVYPISLRDNDTIKYCVYLQDSHGHEIVCAAKRLGWDTLLIVETNKYLDN